MDRSQCTEVLVIVTPLGRPIPNPFAVLSSWHLHTMFKSYMSVYLMLPSPTEMCAA